MSPVLLFFWMPLCWLCDEQVTPLLMNMRRNCLRVESHFSSEEKRSVSQQSDEMLQSVPGFKQNSLLHYLISLATVAIQRRVSTILVMDGEKTVQRKTWGLSGATCWSHVCSKCFTVITCDGEERLWSEDLDDPSSMCIASAAVLSLVTLYEHVASHEALLRDLKESGNQKATTSRERETHKRHVCTSIS